MDLENTRDFVMYAAIFGIFAFAWFGWAQENPPKRLRIWLGAGAIVSMLVAAVGGYLSYINWQEASALNKVGAYELFGIIVLTEIILSFAGAMFLLRRNKNEYIASWITYIVALHFVPLAFIFEDYALLLLPILMVAGAAASGRLGTRAGLQRNTMTCVISACILLAFAVRGLVLHLS